jgi:hypothetical protein
LETRPPARHPRESFGSKIKRVVLIIEWPCLNLNRQQQAMPFLGRKPGKTGNKENRPIVGPRKFGKGPKPSCIPTGGIFYPGLRFWRQQKWGKMENSPLKGFFSCASCFSWLKLLFKNVVLRLFAVDVILIYLNRLSQSFFFHKKDLLQSKKQGGRQWTGSGF